MRFRVKEVLPQIMQCSSVVGSKNSIAILDNLLLEPNGDTLVISASDNDTWLSMKAPIIEDGGVGRFCVNAKDFMNALKNLGDIEVNLTQEDTVLTCSYSSGKFSLPYFSADDYPKGNEIKEDKTECLTDAGKIAKMIAQTDYAIATDPLRVVMNGIYFDFHSDDLSLVASDGHKLSLCQDKTIQGIEGKSFILTAKSAHILASLLSKEEGQIKIAFDGNNVSINSHDFKLVSKLIEGRYPNYKAVIPTESRIKVTINRDDLQSALKRVMPMSNADTEIVKFAFSPNLLTVSCEDIDFSKSASEMVQCDAAEEFTIAFKGSAILQSLQVIDGDDVVMEMTESSRAGVLRGKEEENYSHISLVMPMLIE